MGEQLSNDFLSTIFERVMQNLGGPDEIKSVYEAHRKDICAFADRYETEDRNFIN